MNDQRFGVADVGQMREQFDRVDEFFARLQSALDAEAHDAAEAALQILRGDFVIRIVRQTGISHPASPADGS